MATVSNTRVELAGPRTLKLSETPLPAVPPHGLIIKTKFAGICHTDLHMWEDKFIFKNGEVVKSLAETMDNFRYPLVLGHEIAGEVYAIGSEDCEGAPTVAVGDAVVVYPWFTGCYPMCGACAIGREPACYTKPFASSIGLQADGGWETFVVVERRTAVVPVPAGVGLDVACLVPCSGITAFGAITNALPVIHETVRHKGTCSLLVSGLGGVGMWAVGIAKAVLPPQVKIYALDIEQSKLEWAAAEGIAGTIHVAAGSDDEAASACIRQAVEGGVDVALDFVGTPSSSKRLVECLNRCGILVVVGIAGGSLSVSLLELVFFDLTVRGSQMGDKKLVGQLLELIAQKKVKPPPLNYLSLTPEDINAAFDKLNARKVEGRFVIKIS